jgi:hypothetical protein
MPVTTKWLAQYDSEESQTLKQDSSQRFIVNNGPEWQIIFGPNSAFSSSSQILKIAAQFDTDDFSSIKFAAYLFNTATGSIDNAGSCTFKIYRVHPPDWSESLIVTIPGSQLSNHYFFSDVLSTSLSPAELDGDSTLMIEATMVRLGQTYRDRIYVNHLGVYDSIVRLRNDIEFLDITKKDE